MFGKVADLPYVNRIYLQQVSFFVMGVVTVCIPLSGSYAGLIVISLIFGLCDGVFVCLLGPIAFDIVGPREASQAIGFLLGIFSIPFVVGPPVAGKNKYQSSCLLFDDLQFLFNIISLSSEKYC